MTSTATCLSNCTSNTAGRQGDVPIIRCRGMSRDPPAGFGLNDGGVYSIRSADTMTPRSHPSPTRRSSTSGTVLDDSLNNLKETVPIFPQGSFSQRAPGQQPPPSSLALHPPSQYPGSNGGSRDTGIGSHPDADTRHSGGHVDLHSKPDSTRRKPDNGAPKQDDSSLLPMTRDHYRESMQEAFKEGQKSVHPNPRAYPPEPGQSSTSSARQMGSYVGGPSEGFSAHVKPKAEPSMASKVLNLAGNLAVQFAVRSAMGAAATHFLFPLGGQAWKAGVGAIKEGATSVKSLAGL